MSNTHFVESLSKDPVERAIARKVIRMLNDSTLDRQQRQSMVHKAQRELLQHQTQQAGRRTLLAQAANARMPKGFKPRSILVSDGKVSVGALHRGHGFVWLDAGPAPQGVTADTPSLQLTHPAKGHGQRTRKDPIAERRKALQGRRA